MKGRAVPSSKEKERVAALRALDIPAMRAWAARYAVAMLGDDRTVLISMHEVRVVDRTFDADARQACVAWLLAEYPESTVLPERGEPSPC